MPTTTNSPHLLRGARACTRGWAPLAAITLLPLTALAGACDDAATRAAAMGSGGGGDLGGTGATGDLGDTGTGAHGSGGLVDPDGAGPDAGGGGTDGSGGADGSGGTGATLPESYPLLGYATLGEGTRGGQGDPDPVTVTSGAALQAAIDAKGDGPLIVFVSGHITHDDWRIVIKDVSDLSILGVGADAELDGVGLDLTRADNVIIRNLTIHHVSDGEGDAIRITDYSHHVWVDHCTLYSDLDHGKDYYDGLIDITHASDFITVSWNLLHDHYKVSLIGHSDGNAAEDTGTFHVTYHHNLWRDLSSRLPSVRFGTPHVFDNLYERVTGDGDRAGTALSSRMGACVRAENNRFDDVRIAVMTDQSAVDGAVQLLDNDFGSAEVAMAPTCTLEPPYPYATALQPAAGLPASLPLQVGVGKLATPEQFTTLSP